MSYTYKHVILIGIDGAGNYITRTETPNIDKLFEKGAGTLRCLTSFPSISAECWGAMLLGVEPDIHGLTNHIVERGDPYTDDAHPSIFKLIRSDRPDAVLGAFSNWTPINTGIVEQGLNVDFDTGNDCNIAPRICNYIRERKPEFLFVQFDNVDGAGHGHGYGSKEYLETITREDGYVGDILQAVEDAGIAEDTLVLVTADHGGIEYDHGGDTDEEMYVFFVAAGKTVKTGSQPEMRVRDIPSIVAHALGVTGSVNWQAKLPDGIFEE